MRGSEIDYGDIQGLVRFGYNALTEAAFLLLRIVDRDAARSWLAAADVANAAVADAPPETAMQIAFTADGLRALGLRDAIIEGFATEFLTGMAGDESRSRRLGDVGASAPSGWDWGAPGKEPHLLLMLYAKPGRLEMLKETVKGAAWPAAFSVLACLDTADMGGVEPFGFKDGISQPTLDWTQQKQLGATELAYGNLAALGEFLLGYANEYGKYTDRPLLDPAEDPSVLLPEAEDAPGKRDLGRNGTYLVLRDLDQDVRGFWHYLARQANTTGESPRRLAESMVGRTMDGIPLVPTTARPIAGVSPSGEENRLNHFTYEVDPAGTRCPLGAHIRRANPRNADYPYGVDGTVSRLVHTLGFGNKGLRDDVIASTRFHRLLRRGREYGARLSPEDAMRPGPQGEKSGLRFICLNANITRQFEFVQNAWIMRTKFGGLTEESDPLLGNRQPVTGCPLTNAFSRPREDGVRQRLRDVPQFVTVRGGAYFFLPSLRALRYLASG
jgi:deferrochelatase/peroxidase EfeB